jgi:hypothetical protein
MKSQTKGHKDIQKKNIFLLFLYFFYFAVFVREDTLYTLICLDTVFVVNVQADSP